MAPNGKPSSYALQQRRSPIQSPVLSTHEKSVKVEKECILFSQSVMNGWNPSNKSNQHNENSTPTTEGPEPRILSKKRRDLINAEIRELQNLLPLKKSARERLSYLGILALTNTFIRKATFFKKECISGPSTAQSGLVSDFSSALSGFLLVFNRDGKILYSSDNILDYLGHTVVELASQGDSIYDFVDKDDHEMIRSQLDIPPQTESGEPRELSFFCKMSTSRYMKTQMRSWKNKIVHVVGKYHKPEMSNDWSDTAFFALCTPIESKPVTDVRHHPTPRPTEFKCLHGADMKFIEVPRSLSAILGYEPEELVNTSWYQWIFPEDLNQARQQHLKFVKEDGSAFACVVRMIHKEGHTVWMDITAEKSQESIANTFLCNYIAIEENDVPYFRLHHNLLPFPDHYTDLQRQMLCASSTLLANAVSNDINIASQSPTMAPSHHSAVSQQHMMPVYEADPKSILRRQLMKRKLGSSLDSAFTGPICNPDVYASGMEIFNIPPPNKMIIRRHTSSDLLYSTGSSYNNQLGYTQPQHHPMFMPPPLIHEPSYHTPNPYEYSRPLAIPVSLDMQPNSPPKEPLSPERRHNNQNNNVGITEDRYAMADYSKQPLNSPPHMSQSPQTDYMSSVDSPQHMRNSHVQSPRQNSQYGSEMSPMNSPHDQYQRDDQFFSDVSNIVDCSQKINQQYNQQSGQNPRIDIDLKTLISSYEDQFHNSQNRVTYSNCAMSPNSPPSCAAMETSPSMTQLCSVSNYNKPIEPASSRLSHLDYTHNSTPMNNNINCGVSACGSSVMPQGSPQMTSPQPASPEQPYQLQYSISSQSIPQSGYSNIVNVSEKMQDMRYVNRQNCNGDWMRKFSHMSATEMLFCEAPESSPYYG